MDSGLRDVVYEVQAKGSPRRCGGLGDILSGTTAAALHWALDVSSYCPIVLLSYCLVDLPRRFLLYRK